MITQTRQDRPQSSPSSFPSTPSALAVLPPNRPSSQPPTQPTQVAPVQAVAGAMPCLREYAQRRYNTGAFATVSTQPPSTFRLRPASQALQGDATTLVTDALAPRNPSWTGATHWRLEIDPIHLHLGDHLPSARLVKSSRGAGPSPLLTWHGDHCMARFTFSALRALGRLS